MIKVDIKVSGVINTLNKLAAIDYQLFLKEATDTTVEFVKGRFKSGESASGDKWAANKGAYAEWKERAGYGDKPLTLTGELRDAIYGKTTKDVGVVTVRASMHSAIQDYPWGSTAISLRAIAMRHEFGQGGIEARPFMAINSKEVDYIVGLLNARVEGALI